MRARKWLPLVIAATFVLGCRGGDDNASSAGKSGNPSATSKGSKGTIGVSVFTLDNPFFEVIADNIKKEVAKSGYDTNIQSGDKDVAKQTNQVQNFIVNGVAAIVLCPCDSKAIGPAIAAANAARIPVFTTDIACSAPGVKVVCHIATDNLAGGRQAGEAMIEALGPAGGKVAIMVYRQTETCLLREQGFKEVIEQHNAEGRGGKIDIVAELPCGAAKDQGYKAAEDALQSHPDLVGMFAINDPAALGARAAIEKAGKAEQVKIIGFDGQPEGKQAIKEGKIYADPIQFPDRMGIETAQAIMKHFRGEKVEKQQLIPTKLYRQADAEKDPELK